MGVSLVNLKYQEVQPMCSDCGVALCWCIGDLEYYEWKGFWDDWTCRSCNPNYKGAYEKYKLNNKPFQSFILNKNC